MPAFAAPQAYGARGKSLIAVQSQRKEEQDKANAIAERKQKALEAAKRKKKNKGGPVQEGMSAEEEEAWKLFFLIAVGIFFAVAEALDMDVLIGILLMPFMSTMKYLAKTFDNVSLDPNVWISYVGDAYNHMCKENPAGFVIVDFTFFVIFVNLILFEADIRKWYRERNIRSQGYGEVQDEQPQEQFEEGLTDKSLERLFKDIDVNDGGTISRYLSSCHLLLSCTFILVAQLLSCLTP